MILIYSVIYCIKKLPLFKNSVQWGYHFIRHENENLEFIIAFALICLALPLTLLLFFFFFFLVFALYYLSLASAFALIFGDFRVYLAMPRSCCDCALLWVCDHALHTRNYYLCDEILLYEQYFVGKVTLRDEIKSTVVQFWVFLDFRRRKNSRGKTHFVRKIFRAKGQNWQVLCHLLLNEKQVCRWR